MADFCTNCIESVFPEGTPPDIDIEAIIESLKPGQYVQCLCEGCELRAVSKDEDGTIKYAYIDESEGNQYDVIYTNEPRTKIK